MAVSRVTLVVGILCLVYGLIRGEAASLAPPVAAAGLFLLAIYGLLGASICRIDRRLEEFEERLSREHAGPEALPIRKTRCWGRTRVARGVFTAACAAGAPPETATHSRTASAPH